MKGRVRRGREQERQCRSSLAKPLVASPTPGLSWICRRECFISVLPPRPDHGVTPESGTRWRRVGDLVHQALEHPPEDRASFVHARCGDDRDLQDEVMELLAASDGADDYLARIARNAGALFRTDFPLAQALPEQGTVGSYRLIERLGAGGMGEVFLAERADGQFEMRVAIKLLPRGPRYNALERRFLAERQILASLSHPGIASLLDGGITSSGTPYIVMEFVDGEPIDVYCDRVEASLEDRLARMIEVCEAVRYAHKRGVVHRDLKASNILVTPEGRVKLLDFGIAKVLEDEAGLELTQDDAASPLTVAWASPEQAEEGRVSFPSDVYQLGLLLYRLVTGRGPHVLSGLSAREARERIISRDPPPPSRVIEAGMEREGPGRRTDRRGVAALPDVLAGPVDRIVLKALERDPARRYPHAGALGQDLRDCLEGKGATVARGRPSVWTRVARWPPARFVGALALVGATGLALLHLTGGDSGGGTELPEAPIVAALPFQVIGDADLLRWGPMSATLLGSALDGTHLVRMADPRLVLAALDEAGSDRSGQEAFVAAAVGADLFLTGSIRYAGERAGIRASLHPTHEPGLELATFVHEGPRDAVPEFLGRLSVDVLEALLPDLPVRWAATGTSSMPALKRFLEAEVQYRTGRYRSAVGLYGEAIALDSMYALAYYRQSFATEWGGMGSPVGPARQAFALRNRLPWLESQMVQAHILYREQQDQEAERVLRHAVRRHPESVEGWYQLGEIHFHRGPRRGVGLLASRQAYERVLELDPGHIQSMVHLARLAALEGRDEELAELVHRYAVHASSDEGRLLELEALLALNRGDWVDLERISLELEQESDNRRWLTVARGALFGNNLEGSLLLLSPLFEPGHEGRIQATAHFLAAQIELARGRIDEAEGRRARIGSLSAAGAALAQAQIALHPSFPPDEHRLELARRLLLNWETEGGRHPGIASVLFEDSVGGLNPLNRAPRAYYLSRVALALGEVDEARLWLAALDTLPHAAAAEYSREIQARLAWREGGPGEALEILEAGGPAVGLPYSSASPVALPQLDARYLRGVLLAELGRTDESLAWLESLVEDYAFAIGFLPLVRNHRDERHGGAVPNGESSIPTDPTPRTTGGAGSAAPPGSPGSRRGTGRGLRLRT